MLVDAVVHDRRQMLIARDMKCKRLADFAQGGVPLGLRPAVGVVVGGQSPFAAVRASPSR